MAQKQGSLIPLMRAKAPWFHSHKLTESLLFTMNYLNKPITHFGLAYLNDAYALLA
jgi:hypothetical protein